LSRSHSANPPQPIKVMRVQSSPKKPNTGKTAEQTPWSVICLPDRHGKMDQSWVDGLRALGPTTLFSSRYHAQSCDLTPLPSLRLGHRGWLGAVCRQLKGPTLLLRSGLLLPPYFLERMHALLDGTASARVTAFLGNYNPAFNPLTGLKTQLSSEGIDGLIWNISQMMIAPIESQFEDTLEAAWLMPSNETLDSPALALTDVCFVHDPNQPLEHHGSLSPLIDGALGSMRQRLVALDQAGYRNLPYSGLDAKPVTLHISHNWGGGIARWIKDLAEHDNKGHHLVLASTAPRDTNQYGHSLDLYAQGPGHARVQSQGLEPVIDDTCLHHEGYEEYLRWLIARFGVGRIFVSSLIGHSLDCLTQAIPTAQVLHDFYPASPVLDTDPLQYITDSGDLDWDGLIGNHRSTFKFTNASAHYWKALKDDWHRTVVKNKVRLIAPSDHVSKRWQSLFGHTLPDIEKIPHGFDCPDAWMERERTKPAAIDPTGPLHLVSIGRLSSGKGLNRLLKVAAHFQERVRFTVIGGGHDAMRLFGLPNVDVVLEYDQASLPQRLQEIRPHAAVFLSRVPETWNYVLSEARCLGLRVLVPSMGSFEERVEHGSTGLCYPANSEGLIDTLEKILAGTIQWPKENPVKEPSMAASIQAYEKAIASTLPKVSLRPAPGPPFWAIGKTQSDALRTSTQLAQSLDEVELLHSRIREQAQWLERKARTIEERTRWALNLDATLNKTIEERTKWALSPKWALSLDAALKDREFELQQQRQLVHELQHDISMLQESSRYLEALKAQVIAIEAERDQARRVHSWISS